MLSLPLSSSPIRSLFYLSDLARIGDPKNRSKLLTFRDAMACARKFLFAEVAASSVHIICLKADGDLKLMRFSRNGAHKTIWNFGQLS